MRIALSIFVALALAGTVPARANPAEAATGALLSPQSDEWDLTLALYGWAAGMEGTAGLGGFTADVDLEFGQILSNLDAGAMLNFHARRGRIGFLTDLIYMKLSTGASTPGPFFSGAEAELEQLALNFSGTYRIVESGDGFFELLGGARFNRLEMSLRFRPGILTGRTLAQEQSWWDAIAGFRARRNLTDEWFLSAYADIGAGDSQLTWQAFAGLGYSCCENADLVLGYRHLDYDFQDGGFTYDIASSGILLGLAFAW